MIWFWLAVLLHLVIGFPYWFAGLLAPLWAVALLVLVWLALGALLIRVRSAGARVLWVPVLALAVWLGAMSAGEAFLGWSA